MASAGSGDIPAFPNRWLPQGSAADTGLQGKAREVNAEGDRDLFRFLVEGVTDYAIFMLDPEGRVISWNEGARRMKGYTAEEILGKHFSVFYSPEDIAQGKPRQQLDAARTGGRLEDEGWRVRKDGSIFWADAIITRLADPDGATRGFAKVTRDLTERMRTQESLQAFTRRLQASNRDLERFASVAAHDLQEPLRKIQAFGDRLQTRSGNLLDDQGRDYLSRMLASSTRMRTLIDDLLAYSRVMTRGQPFTLVNLSDLMKEVLADLDERIRETRGRVEVKDLPTLEADSFQMQRLIENLIGNSLKFHKPDVPPVVKIWGRLETGGRGSPLCQVYVQDNGIGFENQYRERIFDAFERLHGRGEYEGTGMGLAICRRIAERHNGQIIADGTPGEGALFTVTLPIRQPKEGENQ